MLVYSKYVDKVYAVITKNNLTQYDNIMNIPTNTVNQPFPLNVSTIAPNRIQAEVV